ncbi:MAG TPA: hypothetical protein VJ842_16435 [Pyrinomonadaceae bacterium]|nr:hypothetical protein [Pyrinomonadaceae bacterium]
MLIIIFCNLRTSTMRTMRTMRTSTMPTLRAHTLRARSAAICGHVVQFRAVVS